MQSQTSGASAPSLVILRRREVEARTGMGCSTIYEGIKAGTFPTPIQLGPKSVGWLESEIIEWISARVAARDAARQAPEKGGR